MTEDAMFIAIFNYIEHLFGKIKPKKLFFMAIDGVAPRAKMNQQRARRFRTALDAERSREKAIQEGAEMPSESPFDSNCITPGTEFMARLTQQLKYFISKKITEDSDWQGVEVVLSGHEVPGEGEHKIMEYIRQAKSQPDYNPNVRHCLYGLDADLIMLGLLSHDPHFCLLREEVTFGRVSKSKPKELEHQNFYLMHLCMVREYLELEFQQLREPGALAFSFDMERVIDDFILMAFFVGNDFLPNLPHLHINEGALALMFDTYKTVLPKAGGYINENGYINLSRLGLLLDELSSVEHRFFEAEHTDANWLRSKQGETGVEDNGAKFNKKGHLVVSSSQRDMFKRVKQWINSAGSLLQKPPLDLPSSLPARDREFAKTLAEELRLQWKTIKDDQGARHMQIFFRSLVGNGEEEDEDDDDDAEAQMALLRVLKKYDNAKVVDVSAEEAQENMKNKYDDKFYSWRNNYYTSKFQWGLKDEQELRNLTENYVQGLQWVLFYYYRGVASWPWFFQHHYSPMISDVKKGLNADMSFELGQPFRPFQQLMGVLPDRSKQIVPDCYHDLMTNPDSPIIDFYPRDFELDMNGKKMDWEAVVKIPFIDERRLLSAMGTKDHLLTEDQRNRNEFGVTLKYSYSSEVNFTFLSSLPGIFNDISNCRCIENTYELPTMDGLDFHVGLVDGVKLGEASLAGFPSLKVLPFFGNLAFHGVSIFQQETRNQSMVITLLESEQRTQASHAQSKLGQVVHIGFPFLQEARVTKVSDEFFDYILPPQPQAHVMTIQRDPKSMSDWKKKVERVENFYSKRLGVIIGDVESLVHVELLKGLKKTNAGDMIKEYGEILGIENEYATQTVVDRVISEDERFLEKAALPIEEEFPEGSRAFFLGEIAFGRPLQVQKCYAGEDKCDILVAMPAKGRDESWARAIALNAEKTTPYMPSFQVARQLSLNPLALSRITSSFSVTSSSLRLNLGLNLKFEAKKQKVLGYSRKGTSGWEFTQKAIDLIVQYMVRFPEFIAGIQAHPQGDMFNDTDFYPAETAGAKMKEIGAWLKSVEAKNFDRVPLDADQLDSDVVRRIESTSDAVAQSAAKVDSRKIRAAPRHALLKPADAAQRLGQQNFSVGDRVVYVQGSGKVPLALTGTVVGKTRTARVLMLDLVLDSSFMSGTTLGERCSPFRGATVDSSSVLNLTERQVIADTRASAARQNALNASAKPYYAPGAHANAATRGGRAVTGQPQLREARPPPALAGSFKSAVSAPRGTDAGANGVRRGPSSRVRGRGTATAPDNAARSKPAQMRQAFGNVNGVGVAPHSQHAEQPPANQPAPGTNLLPFLFQSTAANPAGNNPTPAPDLSEFFEPRHQRQEHPGLGYQLPTNGLSAMHIQDNPNDPPACDGVNGAAGQTSLRAPRRGRSSSNRGGFTVVDNTDPHQGIRRNNPDFKKRDYSAVPPPSGLAGSARGRGRGRAMGRVARGS